MPITNETEYRAACARRCRLAKKSDDAHKYAERLEAEAAAQRAHALELDASVLEIDQEAEAYFSECDVETQKAIEASFRAEMVAESLKSDGEERLRLMEGGL